MSALVAVALGVLAPIALLQLRALGRRLEALEGRLRELERKTLSSGARLRP
jgi:hypothetical protein